MRDKLNRLGKKPLERYAKFVSHHAPVVLAIFFIFTIFMGYQASLMETAGTSQKDWLPEDIEVVNTFELIADQFAGSFSSATIVVEAAPGYAGSDEIRDMRDPRVLRYVDVLAERAKLVYGVVSAESAADVIKEANGGKIPSSLRSVKSLLEHNEMVKQQMSNYICDDNTMSVVRLKLQEDVDEARVVEGLNEVIKGNKPPGVVVELSGDPVAEVTMRELAQETMGKTSFVSFALIIVILIILFASLKYGLIPLLTIVFGLIWSNGTLVLAGFNITPQTSGVMAMIMGIGIDFGIQVTKRFRFELRTQKREDAMVDTLKNVFYPMTITTIAAMTGFLCLGLGKLPVMKDMGTMMAVGVVFCAIAALTVVPAVLVLLERRKG
ncbi:MAG: MMPL family transporter [Methanophagales archaeon]|nr:MMPL family transporter [Methanophagales archaeon]MCW3136864.1 MMPL family transporter [Methanophagales archaeon]MCW3140030.1 MMPL family transporter [Methanophagales archaeon]MCW7069967.1 MMPL family transporter [Methanophagales archaeon]